MRQLSSVDFKFWKMGITTKEMAMGMYKMFKAIQKTTKSFEEMGKNVTSAIRVLNIASNKEGK